MAARTFQERLVWVSRLLLALVAIMFVWDSYVMFVAQDDNATLSGVIRVWNRKAGGLVALGMIAVWIHLFVPLPQGWRGVRGMALPRLPRKDKGSYQLPEI